jgi:hypothetical protein
MSPVLFEGELSCCIGLNIQWIVIFELNVLVNPNNTDYWEVKIHPFLVLLAPFGCLYHYHCFCHLVVHLIHLIFRWTLESNSCPRTMSKTVSPQHLPLDQGASPHLASIKVIGKTNWLNWPTCFVSWSHEAAGHYITVTYIFSVKIA